MAKVGEVFVKLFMDSDEFTQGMEEAEKEAERLEKKMTGTGRTIRGVVRDISERFQKMGEGMIDGAENLTQAIGLPFILLGTLAVTSAKETKKGQAAIKKLADGFKQIQKALAPIGQAILNMAVKYMPPFIKAIQSVSKWFQNLSTRGKELTIAIGGLLIAIGPTLMFIGALVLMLGSLGQSIAFLMGPVGWIVAAIAGLGVAFYKASGGLKPFLNNLKWLGSYLVGAATDGDYLNDAITHLDNKFRNAALAVGKFVGAIHDKLANIADVIGQEFDKVSPKFQAFWNTFVRGIQEGDPKLIGYAIAAFINTGVQMLPSLLGTINWSAATQGIVQGLNFALSALATAAGGINWQAIAQLIANGLGRIAQFAGIIAPALVNGLIQIINKINWAQLGTAFGNLVTTLAPIIADLLGKLIDAIPIETIVPHMITFGVDFAFAFINAIFSDPNVWIDIFSKHWFDILLLIFAPERLIGVLVKVLEKIPFVGAIVAWVVQQLNSLGGVAKEKVGEKIGGWFSNAKDKAIEKLKDLGSKLWEKIDSAVGQALTGKHKKFTDAANDWKNKLLAPFQNLNFKSLVQRAIDAISSIRPPKIKLPHFKLKGWSQWGPIKLPNIGVEWYKSGGLFAGPSIIGVGEAGPEAVVPLSGRRMRPFAEAIASQLGGSGNGIGGPQITNNFYIDDRNVANSVMRAQQRGLWMANG